MSARVSSWLQLLWAKTSENIFTEVLVSMGMAITVYIGFYLGFVIQQTDRVGQALVTIGANNSTSAVAPWVSQATAAVNEFPPQTLLYAFLLVPLLVVPKLKKLHHSSVITSVAFPVLVSLSWLALPAATLSASVPSAFVTIVGSPRDVNVSVTQIYTFIIFYQSFVLALRGVTLITIIWVCARFIGLSRNILWNILPIVIPVLAWLVVLGVFGNSWLPIPTLVISAITSSVIVTPVSVPYLTIGGFLPPYLEPLTDDLVQVAFVLWIISILRYVESRPTYPEIDRLLARARRFSRRSHRSH
jgi:hypothetical protein